MDPFDTYDNYGYYGPPITTPTPPANPTTNTTQPPQQRPEYTPTNSTSSIPQYHHQYGPTDTTAHRPTGSSGSSSGSPIHTGTGTSGTGSAHDEPIRPLSLVHRDSDVSLNETPGASYYHSPTAESIASRMPVVHHNEEYIVPALTPEIEEPEPEHHYSRDQQPVHLSSPHVYGGGTSIALGVVGAAVAGPGLYSGYVPPPPPIPSDTAYLGVGGYGGDSDNRSILRKPSMARRILDRGTKGLMRMKTNAPKKKSDMGTYGKLDEEEEDEEEGYGIDLTQYDSDFLPHSYDHKNGSYENYRTGGGGVPKGATFDLSDDYGGGISTRGTGFYNELQIPVDPNPPNWKPWEMSLPYLISLNVLTLALIGLTEYLIRLSNYLGAKGLVDYSNPAQVTLPVWFAWKYLPTLVGVIFGVLWELVNTEVKRTEPYYQMSRPEGALASNSLLVDYFEFYFFLAPIQALRYKQWAVLTSSMAYIMSYAIIPNILSSILNVNGELNNDSPTDSSLKVLVIDNGYARALQGCFGIVLICGITLTWELGRRKSGLVGDVSGIAGIAAMANKSHILMDFKDLDDAPEKQIHHHISRQRYRLHKMSLYLGDSVAKKERPPYKEKRFLGGICGGKRKKGQLKNPQSPILTLKTGIPFMLLLFATLGIMPVLSYVKGAHVILVKIPFLATALGILIKSVWDLLDKELRTSQPFFTLAQGNASPDVLTLDYTGNIPGVVVLKALKNKHWLLALITFNSVMVEVFTVTIGSFLNRSADQEETFTSRTVSYALATTICCSLIACLVIVYIFRSEPFMPRQPGTIASVLTYIHQSKMVTDFEGMEFDPTKERERKLMAVGKKYGFGWFVGRDKKYHLGVDEEEIKGKWKLGVDFRDGVLQGSISGYDHYDG